MCSVLPDRTSNQLDFPFTPSEQARPRNNVLHNPTGKKTYTFMSVKFLTATAAWNIFPSLCPPHPVRQKNFVPRDVRSPVTNPSTKTSLGSLGGWVSAGKVKIRSVKCERGVVVVCLLNRWRVRDMRPSAPVPSFAPHLPRRHLSTVERC